MADHRQAAMIFLHQIELPRKGGDPTVLASCATANAVLALIDYLQQDDTTTEQWEETGARQAEIIARQETHIHNLEEELAATRAALRAREEADAAENEERKIKEHNHNWIDITSQDDLPNSVYTCNRCGGTKLVEPSGRVLLNNV